MPTRSTSIFSFIVFSLVILYLCSGVFFGGFRTDEGFFMQSSWSMLKGIKSPIDVYIPGGYPYILSKGLSVFNYDLDYFFYVRCFNIFIALTLLIYLSRLINTTVNNIPLSYLISFLSLFYIISMRGFEIRPESIGNLSMVFSFCYILSYSTNRLNVNYYFASVVFSIFTALISTRYTIPTLFIWLASTTIYLSSKNFDKIELIKTLVFSILIATFFLFTFHDLSDLFIAIERINEIDGNRQASTIYDKVLKLGLGKFHYLSEYALIEYYRAIFYLVFFIISIGGVLFPINRLDKVIILTLIASNISSILFLFFIDHKPYNYAVTHEFLLILVSIFCILNIVKIKLYSYSCSFIILSLLLYAFYPAKLVIDRNQPSLDKVFYASQDIPNIRLKSMGLNEILNHRLNSGRGYSAIYQINLMKQICKFYSGEDIYIFGRRYDRHPICMKDEFLYDYFIGNKTYGSIVNQITASNEVIYKDNNYLIYRRL